MISIYNLLVPQDNIEYTISMLSADGIVVVVVVNCSQDNCASACANETIIFFIKNELSYTS